VFRRSAALDWHDGDTLMECLESLPSAAALDNRPFRLPIQLVARDGTTRRYCGSVLSGALHVGQKVTVYPGRQSVTVSRIWAGFEAVESAGTGRAVGVELAETIDIGRGAILAGAPGPELSDRVTATLLWMDESPLFPGRNYVLRAGTC
jgi:bifunctional enzyme CysN/CysC